MTVADDSADSLRPAIRDESFPGHSQKYFQKIFFMRLLFNSAGANMSLTTTQRSNPNVDSKANESTCRETIPNTSGHTPMGVSRQAGRRRFRRTQENFAPHRKVGQKYLAGVKYFQEIFFLRLLFNLAGANMSLPT
jgi:hypothetical protein